MEEKKIYFKIFPDFRAKDILVHLRKDEIHLGIGYSGSNAPFYIKFTLTKLEWDNLLIFLKRTNEKTFLPNDAIAYAGYDITNNKILYANESKYDFFLNSMKEIIIEKSAQIEKGLNKMLDQAESEMIQIRQGETLSEFLFLISGKTLFLFSRDDFKRFREFCVNENRNILSE